MGFGGSSAMPASHPSLAAAANAGSFDLTDFPALGAQEQASAGSSATSTAGGNFFSYASQAGTGVSNAGVMNILSRGTSFTHDEFPALNRAQAPEQRAGAPLVHAHAAVPPIRDHGANATWSHEPVQHAVPPGIAQELARKHHGLGQQGAGWMHSYGAQTGAQMDRIGQVRGNAGESLSEGERGDGKTHELGSQSLSGRAAYAPESEMASLPIHQVLASPADRFGLVGLVRVIKTQDPDMSMLAMGSNLQTMGMDLDSGDALSAAFVTPWSQDTALASVQVEPSFQLPPCYNVQPPPPAQTKVASVSDETLFFIFYSTPRDVLQEVAAQELYARNWRYHKGLHLWLTKEQNAEPLQKTPTYERGTYVFFDPGSWEKVSKTFVLMYEMLEEKPPVQGVGAPMLSGAAAAHPHAPQGKAPVPAARGPGPMSPGQTSPQASFA
ncbi:transcriptional regulator [Malassezia sp. CBS 17886]|nr:transcriptional regulator [Malassezia sp. CBS 17886]